LQCPSHPPPPPSSPTRRSSDLIPETAEPLEAAKIRDRLPREDRERVRTLETVWSTSSTNTVLLARANPPIGTSEVLLAEHQSARSEEHTSELQSRFDLVCRLLL